MVKDGRNSKVKIFKHGDGYRAQVVWLENMKNPDGSQRTDQKNPDPKKRNTPSNQIVFGGKGDFRTARHLENGHIYDPTSGKVYRVESGISDKPNVLTVER